LIVASDGWHSAREPIAIRSLSFHRHRCHRIIVVPSPIVVIVIVDVIDVVVVFAAAIVVHVTFVDVAIVAAILVVGAAAA
jgi:hypothetical protein